MSHNVLTLALLHKLIEKQSYRKRETNDAAEVTGSLVPQDKRVSSLFERYLHGAIRKIVTSVREAQVGGRHRALLMGARSLHSFRMSPWLPSHLRASIDPEALLMPAAYSNGDIHLRGEGQARQTIADAEKYAHPRPEPTLNVPTRVYGPHTPIGTASDPEETPVVEEFYAAQDGKEEPPPHPGGPPLLTEEERAEIAALFPLPVDDTGRSIRPDMIELAMLRRANPLRGASHLVISQGWRNPSNAVYHRRILFRLTRMALRNHLIAGGLVYRYDLRVGTDTEDDLELCKAEKREWDRLRKRLQRCDAMYRWFSTITDEGASRVIFASAPLYDGQVPLEDSEGELQTVMHSVTSLSNPYKRRPAHGGPDDAWQPKQTRTYKWVTVGTRPAAALLEHGQDHYDEAAAVANGVRTWVATEEEVNGRTPEVIVRTRHWAAPTGRPDTLFTLFEEFGFEMNRQAWDREFRDQAVPVG